MAEIKLCRTAYRYSNQSLFLMKLVPILLLVSFSIIIGTDLIDQLKLSYYNSEVILTSGNGLFILRLLYTLKNLRTKEYVYICFIILTSIVTLLYLSTTWFISLKLLIFYRRCIHREGTQGFADFILLFATHVYIREIIDDKDLLNEPKHRIGDVIIEIKRSNRFIYYIHDHKKFIFDDSKCKFVPVRHLDDIDLSLLNNWKGLTAKYTLDDGMNKLYCIGNELNRSISICNELYGLNDYEIPKCNFWKMLFEAFMAPFFQFQIISTLLWILDDYMYYSLMSIISIIIIEAQMVYKRIIEYDRINSMRLPPSKLIVYRDNKWLCLSSLDVYPGDLIFLTVENDNKPTVSPADSLILSGEVIVDESILTGESIPQFKSCIEFGIKNIRSSTIFAGTTIITCRSGTNWNGIKMPNNKSGCLCIIMRTGFESYQGRLVHAIMHSGDRVTASTKEGWCFLGILLSFAIIACIIVFKNSPSTSLKN